MVRKLGIVVAVVLAFVLAGCTTSAAKPIGVVTGLTARCNILVPPVKISLYSGRTLVASATVPAGASYRLTVAPGVYNVIGLGGSTASATVRVGRTVTVNSPFIGCA
jgi:hypothetical protein